MSMDANIHILAERVAEVFNKKIAPLDRRISELESKLKRLELDVHTVRSQTIESIVRSVLGIKIEDIVSATVTRFGAEFMKMTGELMEVVKKMNDVTERLGNTMAELEDLKKLPSSVAEAVKNVKVTATVDTSKLESTMSNIMSEYMKNVNDILKRVSVLEKSVKELDKSLSTVTKALASINQFLSKMDEMIKTVEDMKESLDYVREVSSILEERLRGRGSGEEEEEE